MYLLYQPQNSEYSSYCFFNVISMACRISESKMNDPPTSDLRICHHVRIQDKCAIDHVQVTKSYQFKKKKKARLTMALPEDCDILIIGSGNAGLSAAISAAQTITTSTSPTKKPAQILLIDKCPEEWAGGNTYFTAGAFRTVHNGLPNLLPLVNNVDSSTAQKIDIPPYTNEAFTRDMQRVTGGRTDADLSRTLVEDSYETVEWLSRVGVRFQLSFNRQAYEVGGQVKFWGGLALKTQDGGKGLVKDLHHAARRLEVRFCYSTAAKWLVTDPGTGRVTSVVVSHHHPDENRGLAQEKTINVRSATILAAGGFEANPRSRAQFLGPNWDMALVRGTPYNTGDLLETAIRDISAKPAGNWSGCHCVAWDANAAPDTGNRGVSNEYTKSGYPLGIMVNRRGKRFADEGSDMRNYTYAMIGREILNQPGHVAFQVWDAKTSNWLREEEYRPEVVQRITGASIAELAEQCSVHGLEDEQQFINTFNEYNNAVYASQEQAQKSGTERKWDPSIKDGLSTQSENSSSLSIPKSNWALPVDRPPFLAVKVSAGITFTFGGLAVNHETAAVISSMTGREVPGTYCIGEMLGGLFYDNYPGGSGLTSGAVFGRRAGRAAAGDVLSL